MTPYEIQSYKKAGEIAAQVKTYAKEIIKPGMKLIDIALAIDDKIIELGGEWAFPVNLSKNDIAAHFTPTLSSEEKANGLLKIDVGVAINGYIADTAIPIDLTENNEHKKITELNHLMMEKIIKEIKPGIEVGKIGEIVEDTLNDYNEKNKTSFSIIKGLSGHQLAQNIIHAGLTISNYKTGNKNKLNEMSFAIEPFISYGTGEIYGTTGGGIYSIKNDGQVRDRDSREVLKYIKENYKTRPFCERWLEKAGFKKLKYILSSLKQQKIIMEYDLLVEKSGGIVSQVENTFTISGDVVSVNTLEKETI